MINVLSNTRLENKWTNNNISTEMLYKQNLFVMHNFVFVMTTDRNIKNIKYKLWYKFKVKIRKIFLVATSEHKAMKASKKVVDGSIQVTNN